MSSPFVKRSTQRLPPSPNVGGLGYDPLMDPHLRTYLTSSKKFRHLVKSGLVTPDGEVIDQVKVMENERKKNARMILKEQIVREICQEAIDARRDIEVRQAKALERQRAIERMHELKGRRVKQDVVKEVLEDWGAAPDQFGDSNTSTVTSSSTLTASRSLRPKSAPVKRSLPQPPLASSTPHRPLGHPHVLQTPSLHSSRSGSPTSHLSDSSILTGSRDSLISPIDAPLFFERSRSHEEPSHPLDTLSLSGGHDNLQSYHFHHSPPLSTSTSSTLRARSAPKERTLPSTKPTDPSSSSSYSKYGRPLMTEKPVSLRREQLASSTLTQSHSTPMLTLRYLPHHGLPGQRPASILISQQHCGGNTLTLFSGKVAPHQTFSFSSHRHSTFPFGITIYEDGNVVLRLSACCEYKYLSGHRLGGKNSAFKLEKVQFGSPCLDCQVKRRLQESRSGHLHLRAPPHVSPPDETLVEESAMNSDDRIREAHIKRESGYGGLPSSFLDEAESEQDVVADVPLSDVHSLHALSDFRSNLHEKVEHPAHNVTTSHSSHEVEKVADPLNKEHLVPGSSDHVDSTANDMTGPALMEGDYKEQGDDQFIPLSKSEADGFDPAVNPPDRNENKNNNNNDMVGQQQLMEKSAIDGVSPNQPIASDSPPTVETENNYEDEDDFEDNVESVTASEDDLSESEAEGGEDEKVDPAPVSDPSPPAPEVSDFQPPTVFDSTLQPKEVDKTPEELGVKASAVILQAVLSHAIHHANSPSLNQSKLSEEPSLDPSLASTLDELPPEALPKPLASQRLAPRPPPPRESVRDSLRNRYRKLRDSGALINSLEAESTDLHDDTSVGPNSLPRSSKDSSVVIQHPSASDRSRIPDKKLSFSIENVVDTVLEDQNEPQLNTTSPLDSTFVVEVPASHTEIRSNAETEKSEKEETQETASPTLSTRPASPPSVNAPIVDNPKHDEALPHSVSSNPLGSTSPKFSDSVPAEKSEDSSTLESSDVTQTIEAEIDIDDERDKENRLGSTQLSFLETEAVIEPPQVSDDVSSCNSEREEEITVVDNNCVDVPTSKETVEPSLPVVHDHDVEVPVVESKPSPEEVPVHSDMNLISSNDVVQEEVNVPTDAHRSPEKVGDLVSCSSSRSSSSSDFKRKSSYDFKGINVSIFEQEPPALPSNRDEYESTLFALNAVNTLDSAEPVPNPQSLEKDLSELEVGNRLDEMVGSDKLNPSTERSSLPEHPVSSPDIRQTNSSSYPLRSNREQKMEPLRDEKTQPAEHNFELGSTKVLDVISPPQSSFEQVPHESQPSQIEIIEPCSERADSPFDISETESLSLSMSQSDLGPLEYPQSPLDTSTSSSIFDTFDRTEKVVDDPSSIRSLDVSDSLIPETPLELEHPETADSESPLNKELNLEVNGDDREHQKPIASSDDQSNEIEAPLKGKEDQEEDSSPIEKTTTSESGPELNLQHEIAALHEQEKVILDALIATKKPTEEAVFDDTVSSNTVAPDMSSRRSSPPKKLRKDSLDLDENTHLHHAPRHHRNSFSILTPFPPPDSAPTATPPPETMIPPLSDEKISPHAHSQVTDRSLNELTDLNEDSVKPTSSPALSEESEDEDDIIELVDDILKEVGTIPISRLHSNPQPKPTADVSHEPHRSHVVDPSKSTLTTLKDLPALAMKTKPSNHPSGGSNFPIFSSSSFSPKDDLDSVSLRSDDVVVLDDDSSSNKIKKNDDSSNPLVHKKPSSSSSSSTHESNLRSCLKKVSSYPLVRANDSSETSSELDLSSSSSSNVPKRVTRSVSFASKIKEVRLYVPEVPEDEISLNDSADSDTWKVSWLKKPSPPSLPSTMSSPFGFGSPFSSYSNLTPSFGQSTPVGTSNTSLSSLGDLPPL